MVILSTTVLLGWIVYAPVPQKGRIKSVAVDIPVAAAELMYNRVDIPVPMQVELETHNS